MTSDGTSISGRAALRTLQRLMSEPQAELDRLTAAHGSFVELRCGPARFVIVGSPAGISELLMRPATAFRTDHVLNVVRFVAGRRSIVTSDGDDHRRRRRAVQAAFAKRRIDALRTVIVERTDAAIDELVAGVAGSGGDAVDVYPFGRSLVLDIALRALFGSTMAARHAELLQLFDRSQAFLEQPGHRQLPHPLPFTRRARVRADRHRLDRLVDAELGRIRAVGTTEPTDLLGDLATSGLSDAEIRDQVVTLVGAGYHTTAAALAWTLLRAGADHLLWHELRAEADAALGPPAGAAADAAPGPPPGAAADAALPLAELVVRESLRLHPPAPASPRVAAQDMTVGGHLVRRRTVVVWSPHLAGRDPSVWDDPLAFRPERHRRSTEEQAAQQRLGWVPFGSGPRQCVGSGLAQLELQLILARCAQRLDLRRIGELPAPVGAVVSRPDGGAWFSIRRADVRPTRAADHAPAV